MNFIASLLIQLSITILVVFALMRYFYVKNVPVEIRTFISNGINVSTIANMLKIDPEFLLQFSQFNIQQLKWLNDVSKKNVLSPTPQTF